MRLFLLVLFFLLGCQDTNVVNLKNIIQDDTPKWVKTIKNGKKINKPYQKCYETEVDGTNQKNVQNLVQKTIYQQIANELIVSVNTKTEIHQSMISNQGSNDIYNDVSIKSFADVSGVHIDNFYFDKNNHKAYGYVCLDNNKFNSLQQKSIKKYKAYLKDITSLQNAINKGDVEQANNLILKIKTNYNISGNKTFYQLTKKVKSLPKIDIKIKSKFNLKKPLKAVVYTNKNLYINVVLNQNGEYELLYPNSFDTNNILLKNTPKLIVLKRKILNMNNGELIFYFSDTPLNLIKYTSNKKLVSNWENYIFQFKNNHYLNKITKSFKVVGNNKAKVCLKTDFKGKWKDVVYKKFIHELKRNFKIRCRKNTPILEIKYKASGSDVVDIQTNIILRDGDNEIDEKEFGDIFSNSEYVIDEQIIPRMINELLIPIKENF